MSCRVRTAIAALVLAAASASAAECPSDLAGSCWVIVGGTARGSSSASVYGRSARCSARCRITGGAVIALRDDGTYSQPPNTTAYECPAGVIDVPDEEGAIVERRGKLVLEPFDLAPLDAFLDACVGRDVVIRRYRTTLRIAADGATLSGVAKARTVTPGPVPITTRAVQRFTATRVTTALPAAQRRARDLPACSADLKFRCVTD
jgi:hypothetical protein